METGEVKKGASVDEECGDTTWSTKVKNELKNRTSFDNEEFGEPSALAKFSSDNALFGR